MLPTEDLFIIGYIVPAQWKFKGRVELDNELS